MRGDGSRLATAARRPEMHALAMREDSVDALPCFLNSDGCLSFAAEMAALKLES